MGEARAPGALFTGDAMRGEFYPFQLGVYAARQDLADVTVEFSGLKRKGGGGLGASAFTCLNLGGVDSAAQPFARTLAVPKGQVQPVWCGVQVPESARAGEYAGLGDCVGAGHGSGACAVDRSAWRPRSSRPTATMSRGGCRGSDG